MSKVFRHIVIFSMIIVYSGVFVPTGSIGQEYSGNGGIVDIIKSGELRRIRSDLAKGLDPNELIGRKKAPMIYWGIRYGQAAIVHELLKFGADPDYVYKDKPLLIWAARYDEPEITRHLLDYGADIEKTDAGGQDALRVATWMNRFNVLDVLIEHGAQTGNDKKSMERLIISAPFENEKMSTGLYLKKLFIQRPIIEPRHDFRDGPHIRWLDDSTASVMYVYYDTYDSLVKRVNSIFKAKDGAFSFKGFVFDTVTYHIELPEIEKEDVFTGINKIFALNDVHGYYGRFTKLLKANGIIDEKLNWSWGNGHLVINGDVFDRGELVTETLWLIYKLEKQAKLSGGNVHFILGNHEIMILEGDLRYLPDKYKYFVNHLNWEYSDLFGIHTVLGQWLRTKKSILKINKNLFVHGGISSEFFKEKLHIREINKKVRNKLNKSGVWYSNTLFSKQGPYWYRGYLWEGEGYKKMTEEQLDEILEFYGVKHIIIGHTITGHIQLLYNDKVIAISVPFDKPEFKCEGLLIMDGTYYRTYQCGKAQKLF